jgi:hypothetical protein
MMEWARGGSGTGIRNKKLQEFENMEHTLNREITLNYCNTFEVLK